MTRSLRENYFRNLANSLREFADFLKSPDEDKPGNNQVAVFSEEEFYPEISGMTHGGMSHAIKHMSEFNSSDVEKILNDAISVIKDNDSLVVKNIKDNKVESMGPSAGKILTTNTMRNTFDMINDKIMKGKTLSPEEELLRPFVEELERTYLGILNNYLEDAIDVSNTVDPEEVKALVDGGKTIKFEADFRGSPCTYVLDTSNSAMIAIIGGKIATMFRIDKKGASKEKIAKKFSGSTRILNPAVASALGADLPTAVDKSETIRSESAEMDGRLLLERWQKISGIRRKIL